MDDNTTWVEKYRPGKFDDIVLDPYNRRIFQNIVRTKYFPNLLFYGPPGTGKTTTIINLINEFQSTHFKLNKSLVIHLNASDERGIDIIRNQIYTFVKSRNMFETGYKFVILDEVDYMTKGAQHALKCLMQTCAGNVKFCLICNYISKIDDSLLNEMTSVRFNQLPKSEIYNFVRKICVEENISLSDDAIDRLQSVYKSDIRSMINFIQMNQHLKMGEWNDRIISRGALDDFHTVLHTSDVQKIQCFLRVSSVKYNIDERTIILHYVNHIIRFHPEIVSSQFLHIVSEITHNVDVQQDTMTNYFISQIQSCLSASQSE
jgi:DNA polymerase III delta prime subunit